MFSSQASENRTNRFIIERKLTQLMPLYQKKSLRHGKLHQQEMSTSTGRPVLDFK